MKKVVLLCVVVFIAMQTAMAYVTVSYYNKDSKTYKWKVTIDGSVKEIVFDGSKTSAVTVQGSGKVCVIETNCGKVELKDGAKIEIKDGCIKIL